MAETIREGRLVTGLCGFVAGWLVAFSAELGVRGHHINSAQWRYLMSVPGHRWSWVALFATAALLILIGLATHQYRIRAVGLMLAGFGCLTVAGFYGAAVLIDSGLTTLGYYPWIGCGTALLGLGVTNWRPVRWF